ncbi:hypothetical protein KJ855_03345 [Patescibacteria group bacterium]|nr:hypothetical protein [Patescibacteria group bacterium]
MISLNKILLRLALVVLLLGIYPVSARDLLPTPIEEVPEPLPIYLAKTRSWRWYDDENSVNPGVAFAGENVTPTGMYNHNQVRLRETVVETGGGNKVGRKKIQYSSDSVNFADVGEISSGAVWAYCDGGGVDNSLVSAILLSTSLTGGPYVESGTASSSFNHVANSIVEYDFCLQENYALVNSTYYFRIVDVSSGTPILPDATYNWPSITISNHSKTLEIDANFALDSINMDNAPGPMTGAFDNLIIRDYGGSLAGWSVTATATDLTDGTNIIGIDNLTMMASSINPLLAENTSGISLGNDTLSNTAPLNVATASSGNGAGNFAVDGGFSLYVPIATVPGNYNSTITLTIS